DVAYANGLYVVVGSDGIVLTSEDTTSWDSIDPVTPLRFRSITHAFGSFYAVGDRGMMISSPDGRNWSIIPAGIEGDFFSITFNNTDRLVAVGMGRDGSTGPFFAFVVVSDDGETWAEQQLPELATGLRGITYGNGLYVAVGYDDEGVRNDPVIGTSQNGLDWDKQTPIVQGGAGALEDVAYGGGKYVIVGAMGEKILVSQDALSWQDVVIGNLASIWRGVTYVEGGPGEDGLFVIAGPRILSSPDGENWTLRRDTESQDSLSFGIGYGDGRIVAVGYGGWFEHERSPDVMVAELGFDVDGSGDGGDQDGSGDGGDPDGSGEGVEPGGDTERGDPDHGVPSGCACRSGDRGGLWLLLTILLAWRWTKQGSPRIVMESWGPPPGRRTSPSSK
ncbi:MAG: hypothetical protein JXR96_03490, partial [Deltaproteobacteria bacterium]|nr:hypothetical protein [Deltaproteobacteria bacterium]